MSEATNTTTLPDPQNPEATPEVIVTPARPAEGGDPKEGTVGLTSKEKTMKAFFKLTQSLPKETQKKAEELCRRLSGSQEGLPDNAFDKILDDLSLVK